MVNIDYASASRLTDMSLVTAGNLSLSLLALPLIALLGQTVVENGPV